MQLTNVPFNLDLVQDPSTTLAGLAEISSDGLLPVKSGQIFANGMGEFEPQGLYSNLIFGKQGTRERYKTLAYINLKVKVFHPLYFKRLCSLKGLYKEILGKSAYAKWDEDAKDFVRSDMINGSNGYHFFLTHFKDIVFQRTGSPERDQTIDFLSKYRDKCLISRLIVTPAGLRDVEVDDGHPKEDEINPMYRKLITINKTINVRLLDLEDPILDAVRNNITNRVLEIYLYIFNMVKGKKGFFKAKVASRRVASSTRGVLVSQEVGSRRLGSPLSPGLHTTQLGIFQYIKGIEPLMTNYHLQHGIMQDFFENLHGNTPLVDMKTLAAVKVNLSYAAERSWSNADGLNGLLNAYGDTKMRLEPVKIDGYYAKLIYQDNEKFIVLNGIEELPKGLDKKLVHPMTWSELFYITLAPIVDKTRVADTRYPVLELGSIYPSKIQILTNSKAKPLQQYTQDLKPIDFIYPAYPAFGDDTYFEAMTVSPFRLKGLSADFDGDLLTALILFFSSSVEEVDKHLNEVSSYVDPAGGTYIPYTTDLINWVLSFTTGDQ